METKPDAEPGEAPSRAEAFGTFFRIGILSFGGPAAQIALMHRLLVDEKKWLGERDYLGALGFCMLLPGPEAMQLATYSGWRLHGVSGGLVAGLLFVLPGALIILALASVYSLYGDIPAVSALFLGVKAAVLVIVVEALIRVSRRALESGSHYWIAALAFGAIFFLAIPFPAILLAAAAFGFLAPGNRTGGQADIANTRVSVVRTAGTVILWIAIWWTPLLILGVSTADTALFDIGMFFSKLAVVTFGGAYAVLAYMAQQVVTDFGWMTAGEMMDGLGLAETTPGPLILVTEFVGFIAAFRQGGFWLGMAGALVALWATFIPCFLWIFAGAPYISWIATQPRLKSALSAITAAVVGVMSNLSIWFGLHVTFAEVNLSEFGPVHLWQPNLSTLDWRVPVLAAVCGLLLIRLRWNILSVLSVSAGLGWILSNTV